MNYEKLIIETVSELESIEKKQQLVRNEKRVQFLKFLKTGQPKRKPKRGIKLAGNCGKRKKYGSFTAPADW